MSSFYECSVTNLKLASTVPAFKMLLAGTVPAFKKLLAGIVPTCKRLLAGTIIFVVVFWWPSWFWQVPYLPLKSYWQVLYLPVKGYWQVPIIFVLFFGGHLGFEKRNFRRSI